MQFEKRNAYFCKKCRKVTITVDVDEGVTPMFISCIYCGSEATSFFYQIPPCIRLLPADMEWYSPKDPKELKTLAEIDHVFNGGLILRKRTDAKPILLKLKN